MLENIVEKSFGASLLVGLLVCAVIGLGIALIYIYKKADEKLERKDNLNRDFTNNLVNDLKKDIKELREENKSDKQMFVQAIDSFSKSTDEFLRVGKDLAEIKSDIKSIDKEITTIKSKIDK